MMRLCFLFLYFVIVPMPIQFMRYWYLLVLIREVLLSKIVKTMWVSDIQSHSIAMVQMDSNIQFKCFKKKSKYLIALVYIFFDVLKY